MFKKKPQTEVIVNLGEQGNGRVVITRKDGKEKIEYFNCTKKELNKYKRDNIISNILLPIIIGGLLLIILLLIFIMMVIIVINLINS